MALNNYIKYIFQSNQLDEKQISSNIKISAVTNFNDFKEFYKVPWLIYKNNEFWIPPFWSEIKKFFRFDNFFWKHAESKLFILQKNSDFIGRIAAIIDRNFVSSNQKIGFFGFFECINDFSIASELFQVVQEWLSSRGMTHMYGPINARVDMGSGFLLKEFNSTPYLFDHYSPGYYTDFAKDYGMKKHRDLISYQIDLKKEIPKSVHKTAQYCESNGIKIRPFNRFQFKKDMILWTDILINEFSNHWGYTNVPLEEIQTRFGINMLRWIVDPPLFLIAEKDNESIGFRWSLPDYNQIFKDLNGKLGIVGGLKVLSRKHRINRGRFIIMGIKKKYRNMGIGTYMNYHTLIEMKRRGYISAEYGWIDEDNIASLKAAEKIGGKIYKRYRVYEKKV
jgi:hypothetical protein